MKGRRFSYSQSLVLCLGLILTISGASLYYSATAIAQPDILPQGGIDIWAGPALNSILFRANVSGTWIIASTVENTISIEVYFEYPQYQTMHFYAVIPFTALSMATWVDRNIRYDKGDTTIGEIKSAFHTSLINGATIANASFTPSPSAPYFTGAVGLAVKFAVKQLVAKADVATDTVILTFAGQTLIQPDMQPYTLSDTQPLWRKPLLVTVQFPPDAFLSSETFPAPVAYDVTSQYRYVSFAVNFYGIDFVNPGTSLVQTVSLSFMHPERERQIQRDLFLGGLLLGVGVPLLVDSLKNFLQSPELQAIVNLVKKRVSS